MCLTILIYLNTRYNLKSQTNLNNYCNQIFLTIRSYLNNQNIPICPTIQTYQNTRCNQKSQTIQTCQIFPTNQMYPSIRYNLKYLTNRLSRSNLNIRLCLTIQMCPSSQSNH
jgi:hypothetical protein